MTTLSYELTTPMCFYTFNLHKFASEVNLDDFVSNPGIQPCSSKGFLFVDKDHKYILTGDLRFIENNKL